MVKQYNAYTENQAGQKEQFAQYLTKNFDILAKSHDVFEMFIQEQTKLGEYKDKFMVGLHRDAKNHNKRLYIIPRGNEWYQINIFLYGLLDGKTAEEKVNEYNSAV